MLRISLLPLKKVKEMNVGHIRRHLLNIFRIIQMCMSDFMISYEIWTLKEKGTKLQACTDCQEEHETASHSKSKKKFFYIPTINLFS